MKDIFSLKNRVAVITGASGALAGGIARHFGSNGVTLALLTRKKESLTDLLSDLTALGAQAQAFEVDILSEASLKEGKDKIVAAFGKIDILLNVAGGNLPGAVVGVDQTIFDMKMEDFDEVTRLNLNGTVLPSLIFGEQMAKQGSGCIVNYSSMAVPRVITRAVGYGASKAAMENFTRMMAVELALKLGEGIRVNAIAPGFFIGKQNEKLLLNPDGSLTPRGEAIIRNTPFQRFGNADELNGAIHFLCSDAAKFITGVTLPVDGGFSAFSGV